MTIDIQTATLIVLGVQTIIFTTTLIVLIYQNRGLATQNRQLSHSLRTATYMDIMAKGNALFDRVIDFPQALGPIMFGELPGEVDTEQTYLKRAYILALLNLFHWVCLQYSQGNIDADSWGRWKDLIGLIAGRPEVQDFWQNLEIREKRYIPQFVTMMNECTGTTAA